MIFKIFKIARNFDQDNFWELIYNQLSKLSTYFSQRFTPWNRVDQILTKALHQYRESDFSTKPILEKKKKHFKILHSVYLN